MTLKQEELNNTGHQVKGVEVNTPFSERMDLVSEFFNGVDEEAREFFLRTAVEMVITDLTNKGMADDEIRDKILGLLGPFSGDSVLENKKGNESHDS